MACFTDLDYRNKFYPILLTLYSYAAQTAPSYGCYDAMNDASKLYQFYFVIALIGGLSPVTENCFVQKTEDQQLVLLNQAILSIFPS